MYLLNREQHTVGQRTPSSKPSVSLSAPDILPLHCTIRRHQTPGPEPAASRLVLEPIPGAPVSVNFAEVGGRAVVLRHGDLLSLGLYYLLLFKDPAQAQPLPAQALARLRAIPRSCGLCGAALRARGASASGSAPATLPRPRLLHLEFEPEVEDALLQRILTLVEPGGDDHKLAPAFLLCLCIQHSATRLEPGSFGQLLLKIAKAIRETVWVSHRRAGCGHGRWEGACGCGRCWVGTGATVGSLRASLPCLCTPSEPGVSSLALCLLCSQLWHLVLWSHGPPKRSPATACPGGPEPQHPLGLRAPCFLPGAGWSSASTLVWSPHQPVVGAQGWLASVCGNTSLHRGL